MRGRKSKIERVRIATGYARVSTGEQSTEGHSLAAQETRLHSLAQSQDVELGRVFVDAGYSAGTLKRPAVRELLAAIQRG